MSNLEVSGDSGKRLTHEDMMGLVPFANTLGLELISATPERVEGRLAYSLHRCAVGGVLHGGALMAMADNFGGVCAYLNPLPGAATSTIESKTNFFRAVREGHVNSVPTRCTWDVRPSSFRSICSMQRVGTYPRRQTQAVVGEAEK